MNNKQLNDLRIRFACAALTGIASQPINSNAPDDKLAKWSWNLADEMIKTMQPSPHCITKTEAEAVNQA